MPRHISSLFWFFNTYSNTKLICPFYVLTLRLNNLDVQLSAFHQHTISRVVVAVIAHTRNVKQSFSFLFPCLGPWCVIGHCHTHKQIPVCVRRFTGFGSAWPWFIDTHLCLAISHLCWHSDRYLHTSTLITSSTTHTCIWWASSSSLSLTTRAYIELATLCMCLSLCLLLTLSLGLSLSQWHSLSLLCDQGYTLSLRISRVYIFDLYRFDVNSLHHLHIHTYL